MTGRTFLSFFVPGGIFFISAALLMQARVLAPWLPAIVQVAPGVVLAAAILLGWRFNRSRLVFAVLMLAIADRSLLYWVQGASATTASGKLIYHAVSLLLPLNLGMLSLLKERGIATPHGMARIGLILAQPLAVAALCHYRYFTVDAYLEYAVVRAPLLRHLPTLALSQPALIAALAGLLLAGCALFMRRGPMENGFLWALLTTCFALAARRPGPVWTFYFCVAGFILVVSVIEASYAMAFRDELTDLPARRSLNELLLRMGSRYTVAMVDIDHFKKFNDTYGHDVGDQVLRMVAMKLSGVTGGGKAFRYGGEEFAVVFPGMARDEALPHLEHLRMTIKTAGFVLRGRNRPRKKPDPPRPGGNRQKSVSVTVSIGVAERNGQQASWADVIKMADNALYRAKKAGRNRVST